MKRLLYKFKTDTKGAVTLFFVMIIAAVFLFYAVLIDYARLLAAEQQSEYALQSAVRSSLAGYDSSLREYGLFGIDKSAVEGDFEGLLKENIEATSNDEAFTFIDPVVENASVEFSRPLADPDILKHQILEEMKYKAPVEVVKELIQKFTFITTAMKESSAFIDVAEKIQEDFENREEQLDGAETLFDDLDGKIATFKKNLTNTQYSKYPQVNYFTDVVHHFKTYSDTSEKISELESEIESSKSSNKTKNTQLKTKKEELEELKEDLEKVRDGKKIDPPKTEKELNDEIEELEEEIEVLEASIQSNDETVTQNEEDIKQAEEDSKTFKKKAEAKAKEMRKLAEDIVKDLKDISEKIRKAKDLNAEIKNTIETANNNAESNYQQAEEYVEAPPDGVNGGSVTDVATEIQNNSAKLDDYPYEPAFFDEIKEPIDQAIEEFENVPTLFKNIEKDIDVTTASKLKEIKETALEKINKVTNNADSGSETLTNDRKEFKESQEGAMDQNNKQADQQNKKAEEILNDAVNLANDQGIYDELKGFVDQYNAYAQGSEGAVQEIDLSGDAGDSAGNAMDIVDSIFKGIGSILTSARDRLYVNEYILLHFQSTVPTGIQNTSDYLFENREVEYILYGQHASSVNYSMALGQLFAIRFAIRFIDAFTQPYVRAAGHPLAVFVAALAHALKYSVDDLNDISSGKNAPLINRKITPPSKIEVTYKDYIRLFLFMNPSGDARLRRIMAVVEHKTGANLTERHTFVKGTVETSARLVFVPQIADGLNLVGALDGDAQDGEFIYKKEAYFSY